MENFYEHGLNFSCKRCSHCCCGEPGYVFLSMEDLTKLSLWFRLEINDFIKEYCRLVPFWDGSSVLSLKEKENYECIFWKDGQGCSVYEARPVQCSTYPFWSRLLQNEDAWNSEMVDCPGINTGDIVSKEEIEKAHTLYKNNKPIHMKSLLEGIK